MMPGEAPPARSNSTAAAEAVQAPSSTQQPSVTYPSDSAAYLEERRRRRSLLQSSTVTPALQNGSSQNTGMAKHPISPSGNSYNDPSRGRLGPVDAHFDEKRRHNGLDNRRYRAGDEEMGLSFYDSPRHSRFSHDFYKYPSRGASEVLRLPWTNWMTSSVKAHFVATLGEFVGTTMFLFFAFAGTEVAEVGIGGSFDVSAYLYIALSFGFSLMTNVWIFFRISGGLFNPAVTLGMLLVGAIPPIRAFWLFIAQMVGGIAASAIVLGLFPVAFGVRTTLSAGTTHAQGVLIEAILTAELVFTIFMLAKEKHRATFIAPIGIGLALFIAELVGVYWTGGSLNPARSFGPCVVSGTFESEHWIYWVGPLVGSLLAVIFYKFIKILEYEMANPGQDARDEQDAEEAKETAEEQIRRSQSTSQSPKHDDDISPPPKLRVNIPSGTVRGE